MNISMVQKTRFLENIYKLYYSNGIKPTDHQIKKAFSDYFSVNKPGFPLRLNYNALNSEAKTNVDLLNELMVNSLFNLDVLYDTILDSNEELFQVVTSLNKNIENLKAKRKALEAKVDDLIFANNNSEGYFYSYTENFSNIDKVDTFYSSAYVDILSGYAMLSAENSDRYTVFSLDNIINSRPTISLYENGTLISNTIDSTTFNNVFDGLNDTYWMYEHRTSSPIPVALTMDMPISNTSIISKVEGYVLTSSPLDIQLVVSPVDGSPQDTLTKLSSGDYSSFSFSLKPKAYSNVRITFFKKEPDLIDKNSQLPYVYRMGLRDLIIGASTRSKYGTIVSKPISLPVESNDQLVIDSVSMEANEQFVNDGVINYYISEDNPSANTISDFNWIPISPTGSENAGFTSVVNFNGSVKNVINLSSIPEDEELELIPIDTTSKNINDLNPNNKIYENKTVHRIAALDNDETYINPVLLGNTNSFKHFYILNNIPFRYKDIEAWNSDINAIDNTLLNNILYQQLGTIAPGINSPSSGYVKTKMICDSENNVINTIKKSVSTFDLAVYLNGVRIADLPSGQLSQSIEWNFLEGINDIVVTYDKAASGQISFSLTEGIDLNTYGSIFTDYFFYLDKFDFRNKNMNDNFYFTIDNPFGRKEIIASSKIENQSRFSYISNNATAPKAIRYRIDFSRFENPFVSPKVDSLKIKFKHKDL
jgi:hypothetical protein